MIIHCNKCFRQKDVNVEQNFYVSSCKHVLCSECVQDTCAVCDKPCKWLLISRKMPSSAAVFFAEPRETFQEFQHAFKFQLDQEAEFCKNTLKHFPPILRKLQKNCEGLEQLDARFRNEIEVEKQRLAKLKAYLAYSEQRCTQTLTQRHLKPKMPTLSSSELSKSTSSNRSEWEKSSHYDTMSLDSMKLNRETKNFFL